MQGTGNSKAEKAKGKREDVIYLAYSTFFFVFVCVFSATNILKKNGSAFAEFEFTKNGGGGERRRQLDFIF